MTRSFPLRLAAVSGWIAFIGVVGAQILIPMAIAGQPPTLNTPVADAMAYFGHRELIALSVIVGVLLAGVPVVPLGVGLRRIFTGADGSLGAAFADLGFLILIVTVPIYVVSNALGAGLFAASSGDRATFAVLHGIYQLLYNGAADVLEGAWIGAFSIAALSAQVPRWLGWLGIALALSRWLKALIPVSPMPETVAAVSGLLFLAWFLSVVVTLTVTAWREATGTSRLETVSA